MDTSFDKIISPVVMNKYSLERQEEPTIRGCIQAVNQWYAEGRWFDMEKKILVDKQLIESAGEIW